MGFKTVMQRLLAMLIIGGALIFGMSGIYHEAPWIIPPLIGSVKIELGGERLSADTETLTTKITKREIAQLAYFPNLRSVDFRGSNCYPELSAWARSHPEIDVLFSIPLPDGQIVDSNALELDLTRLTSDQVPALLDALTFMPDIQRLRFGEVGGAQFGIQDMQTIRAVLPNAEFHFSALIGGRLFDGEATSLDLHDARREDVQELAVMLSCMPNLQTVELGSETAGMIPWADIALLKSVRPDVQFHYSFTLYGKDVTLDTEKLDYRGVKIPDNGNTLYSVLSCMNRCTYLDMDNTGVSDESLERLRDLFPQTKIVWRVWFGENYSVRTDVERILASKPTVGGMIYDASVLKYCTDVKYLDLGHNYELADFSFLAAMPKLEVLIVAMDAITNIEALRNCPNLEYLELNSTNIKDLSPLAGCTKIHHLNIACCPNIKDISPLYGMTELERLWIGRDTPVPAEQVAKMKSIVPGCTINTTTEDPTEEYWRYTRYDPEEPKYYWVPRYELLRNQMGYNYQEYSFYWLDPYCDLEAPEEFRGKFGKEVYGL